ncbi:MAG: N-acetylneuraminate synthase family protein [Planctomycetota bacterium]
MRPIGFQHASATQGPDVAVVAEIGVNHDGSADTAKRLIDAAKQAGADAVKFQCFDPGTLLSGQGELAGYQRDQGSDARSMLDELKLSGDVLSELREHARQCDIAFAVTPFSVADIPVLESLDLDAVKIASPDAVNPWLLESAAQLGRPMWVSTGTCDLDELPPAAALLRDHPAGGALLHCVSAYPTPTEDVALGGIVALREAFALRTGYSDHTRSTEAGGWAVLAGACLLEKHLTHNRQAAGPDHAASLEPAELSTYVANVKHAAQSLGPIAKRCSEAERDVRQVSRQSLSYTRDLPAGHVLTREDLQTRRPGSGIPGANGPAWIGRRLSQPVKAGSLVHPQDAEN